MLTTNLQACAEQCARLINQATSMAALTGAGISTAAGIPDFRGPQGLYVTRRYNPDTVFDIRAFTRNPGPFYDFARDFIGLENKIQPTFTHQFLAHLENSGKLKGIVTQNIDALHHKAGSTNVLEMHGSFWRSFCLECRTEFSYDQMKNKIAMAAVPHCDCGGVIKPDIVFFGENVKYLQESTRLAAEADLFLVLGSSCVVYPAASIPDLCRGNIVIVNKGDVHLDSSRIVLTVESDLDTFFKRLAPLIKET